MSAYLLAELVNGDNLPRVQATSDTITVVLNIVFGIIGGMAVLLMVIAGIRYITSQGDPAKLTEAKNRILYITIGLVITASAAAIVNFASGNF